MVRRGRVGDYDEAAGIGVIIDEAAEAVFVHCTAIADGSRSIEVGAHVVFRVVPGRCGRWEAADVVAV